MGYIVFDNLKKTIVIYSGPSWEKWDFRNIDSGGIGGSETWQIMMSREFSKLGYRVINFNDCEKEILDGSVRYIPFTHFPEYIEYNWFDYFVCSRTLDPFRLPIRAGKKYVMAHDIWISNNKNLEHKEKVDNFCVLSEWHKEFFSSHHEISKEKIIEVFNGVDLKRFEKKVERHPYRLIYSSSLDRGLETLLYLFDFLKLNIPELELHIFYGMENWEKTANFRLGEKEKIEKIKNDMKKDGVFYHGRIGQEQLAEEMLKSSLWVYPTDFEETFCITAIEAQAAGLPIIASNYAGLKTTVSDSGILIGNSGKDIPFLKENRVEFVEKTIELLRNKEEWLFWSKKSLENAKSKTWELSAKFWVEKVFK